MVIISVGVCLFVRVFGRSVFKQVGYHIHCLPVFSFSLSGFVNENNSDHILIHSTVI